MKNDTDRADEVDLDEATREAVIRPPHIQIVELDGTLRRFEGTQFVAHLKSDMRFNKNGDVELTLIVPFRYKHLAVPMSDAMGIPLSVDVAVWQPFTDATQNPNYIDEA